MSKALLSFVLLGDAVGEIFFLSFCNVCVHMHVQRMAFQRNHSLKYHSVFAIGKTLQITSRRRELNLLPERSREKPEASALQAFRA